MGRTVGAPTAMTRPAELVLLIRNKDDSNDGVVDTGAGGGGGQEINEGAGPRPEHMDWRREETACASVGRGAQTGDTVDDR